MHKGSKGITPGIILKQMSKNEFETAVITGDIKFPLKRNFYSTKDIMGMFDNLKKYNYKNRIVRTKYDIKNVKQFTNGWLYNGNYCIITTINSDYHDFNMLSDMFQEESRMKCVVYSTKVSPWDFFHLYPGIIWEYCMKMYNNTFPENLRESIWKLTKECTSFRPSLIMSIIQMFDSKSVLDFSAGWGDRLIGSMAAGVDYYGVDPNPRNHKGYKDMIKMFAPKNHKYKVIESGIENAKLPTNRNFDLIFTSPPYFDLEIYVKDSEDGGKLQSTKNKSEDSWFKNFLMPALKKCHKVLVPNGIMAININQKSKHETYVKRMVDYISSLEDMIYLGVISYANKTFDNPQPIWLFRRHRPPGDQGGALDPIRF
jgi:16S rRNA G966 N2-methylase RsmD